MAFFFLHYDGANFFGDVFVGRAAAEQEFQVVIVLAEKAGAEFSVGGDADARAVAAERLGDGSDESDFARTVATIRGGEFIFAGGFALLVGNLDERPARVNAAIDFGGGDHRVASPGAVGIERHELDEAHDQVAFARELGEGFDFVVIEAAHQHGVHFYGPKTRSLRGVDTCHHLVESFCAGDAFEFFAVERIEADVDAVETGGEKSVEALREQVAVGSDREIVDADCFEVRDKIFDAGADKRFATRDANFLNAHADENAREALIFVPFEQLVVRHVVIGIGRAAINAAEVAAVGDRDAEVGDLAAEFVVERHWQQ